MGFVNRAAEGLRGGIARASRKLATDVVTSGIATLAVTLAFSNLKPEPTIQSPLPPAPVQAAADGKIVARIAAPAATDNADVASARRVADFVKLSGVLATVSGFPPAPAVSLAAAAPVKPAAAERAPERPAKAKARPVLLASPMPVPPARPALLALAAPEALAPVAAAIVDVPVARASFLGLRLPTDMLPSGERVMTKVSALGGALIERLSP